jgi:peptidoglycan hydrolase-like protein with peptidoglycan-binding domain
MRSALTVVIAGGIAATGALVSVPAVAADNARTHTPATARTLEYGATGPGVTDIQKRLRDVGILGPVTGTFTPTTEAQLRRFQWKFGLVQTGDTNRATLNKLTRLTRTGDRVPAICKTRATAVCVDKLHKTVRYYRKGVLLRSVDARFGREGARTREGNWSITRKRKDDYSTLYRSPMPWSSYFSGGQALHYSKYFAAAGYNGASHGCINIGSKKDAKWLWKRMPVGSFFKVYR